MGPLLYAEHSLMRAFSIALVSMVALGCVPESAARHCEGSPDFVLTLTSPTGTFPPDTEIKVTFGGGSQETYWLAASNDPEVLFCETTAAADAGSDAGGASGAAANEAGGGGSGGAIIRPHGGSIGVGDKPISSIRCDIWSGGPATLAIRAATWHTTRELKPDEKLCSPNEDIVLGEPDPKP